MVIYKGLNPTITIMRNEPVVASIHLVKKTKGKQPRNIQVVRPISGFTDRKIFIELTAR